MTRAAGERVVTLGATLDAGGARVVLPAPSARAADVRLVAPGAPGRWQALEKQADGTWSGLVAGAAAGDRYQFRVDEGPAWPDPASRFQPEGVHGPSELVDPARYEWHDAGWTGVDLADVVVYELHVGTFTPQGTFAAAGARLPDLAALGVTAVELMPVADFPGRWNWGYDGVSLFAPSRAYGRPDDLRAFVDRAHGLGLAVYLDVVYNHLGPDGAYLAALLPAIFSSRHASPWGRGLNFDDEGSELLRRVVIENAVYWVTEFHVDGLRFDATHAIVDDSPRHVLAAATAAVRSAAGTRRVQLFAEDHRNLASMVAPARDGGLGFDAVWADDFHHQVRRCLAGDADGYYADFTGSPADIARTVRQGWFYAGQWSPYHEAPRGTDPGAIDYPRFVIAIQNHDQIGNRAFGDRLSASIDAPSYRAASMLLLLAPEVPLLFMGQEWAASTPFQYFTDHEPELGRLVTEGRRREFERFDAFARADAEIPDPQAPSTFERSRLDWRELDEAPHRAMRDFYRALLGLRRRWQPGRVRRTGLIVEPAGENGVVLGYRADPAISRGVVVWLRGSGTARLDPSLFGRAAGMPEIACSTEWAAFASDGAPLAVTVEGGSVRVEFSRPGGVALEWRDGGGA